MPDPQGWQGVQMPHSCPGRMAAAGIDWCITCIVITPSFGSAVCNWVSKPETKVMFIEVLDVTNLGKWHDIQSFCYMALRSYLCLLCHPFLLSPITFKPLPQIKVKSARMNSYNIYFFVRNSKPHIGMAWLVVLYYIAVSSTPKWFTATNLLRFRWKSHCCNQIVEWRNDTVLILIYYLFSEQIKRTDCIISLNTDALCAS